MPNLWDFEKCKIIRKSKGLNNLFKISRLGPGYFLLWLKDLCWRTCILVSWGVTPIKPTKVEMWSYRRISMAFTASKEKKNSVLTSLYTFITCSTEGVPGPKFGHWLLLLFTRGFMTVGATGRGLIGCWSPEDCEVIVVEVCGWHAGGETRGGKSICSTRVTGDVEELQKIKSFSSPCHIRHRQKELDWITDLWGNMVTPIGKIRWTEAKWDLWPLFWSS